MVTYRSQVLRRRKVALTALSRYALPRGPLRFVTHGENTTFRLDGGAGRFLVRVHRPQRHGRDVDPSIAISSELCWLQAIRSGTDLAVPEAVAASDGHLVVEVEVDGDAWHCSVLRWLDGRIHENSARPGQLRLLGAAMARLHAQADAWTPPPWFTRIHWDAETFFGDVMVYGDAPASRCWELLPIGLRQSFGRVRERMGPILAADPDSGLIHADLHLGNAVFQGGCVKLIDFDDSGYGPRLYDVAVALWELRDLDDYPLFHDALLEGYRSERAIDTTLLDEYIALRQVAFQLWYTGMAQTNPSFAEGLSRAEGWSADMLELLGAGSHRAAGA
ncbi:MULTISPECIES: phosphotransferase [Microbacterium]|uniref:phosphotransferase enzyme family protein n=1 Tax=Microbacterium TaxID=33882 RepID=UPI000D6532FB|nr:MULTISPECIES: phosphotransferase [Microbacterium]